MRSVAISALLILLARPYSLFSPGFQMSFAAVAALVAGYEVFQRRDKQRNGLGASGSSLFSSSWRFISGLSLTSLIAGSATLFISAWHFHQIATLGLIANVLAMPLVSLVLMPFILLSALMLPFGLESITLIPVSLALDWILGIAERISALTPLSNVGAMRPDMAILFCLGFVVLIVFRSRLRLLGLVILVAMPFFYEPVKIPDLVIAESGRAAGLKGENGNFQILFPSRENFITGIWTQAYARGVFSKHASDKETCNRERCIIELYGGTSAHIVYNPDLLDTSCRSADILIAPRLKWVRCRDRQPQRIIKRHDFEQYGAHAIYLSGSKHNKTTRPTIEIQTSLPEFSRPWHRNVPSYDD